MAEVLHREFVYIWYYFTIQLRQIFPYWVLGMVIGSLVSIFAKERIHHMLRSLGERKLGVLGIIAASGLRRGAYEVYKGIMRKSGESACSSKKAV